MKKTVKILATILACLMLISIVAACGDSGSDESLTINEGILLMATSADFPPYEFIGAGGEIVGIDPEIAAAIAGKLGLELQVQDMEFTAVLAAIETGMVDIAMAGLTVTEERLEQMHFSISYASGVQAIIVPEGSPISSVDDLFADGAFHTIGVQLNTTGDLYSTWDLEDNGLASVERFTSGADAIVALVAGRVDAVIIDNQPAISFVAANPGLVILETEFANEEYAIAINLENTALLEAVNKALTELKADGTIQRILDKYIN